MFKRVSNNYWALKNRLKRIGQFHKVYTPKLLSHAWAFWARLLQVGAFNIEIGKC